MTRTLTYQNPTEEPPQPTEPCSVNAVKPKLLRCSTIGGRLVSVVVGLSLSIALAGCLSPVKIPPPKPSNVVADVRSVSAAALPLDSSQVEPMYTELLPIDLFSVIRVVAAENIDIRLAKYQVDQLQGRYESTVGGLFPVVVPTAIFEHLDGSDQIGRAHV